MKPGASFSPALASVRSASPFEWPRDISSAERKSLIAGGLGWMLDAMDVMLYSFVLAYLMTEFGITKSTGGLLNSLTLIASAIGGLFFGILADRIGRTRALMASILVYSLALLVDCPTPSPSSRPFVSFSAWAWEANGAAAPRSSPKRGAPSTAAEPSA